MNVKAHWIEEVEKERTVNTSRSARSAQGEAVARYFSSHPLASRPQNRDRRLEEPAATADKVRQTRPVGGVERYVTTAALSPNGSLLACIVSEREAYPRAMQIVLDDAGEPIAESERNVTFPIEGGVRDLAYSPDGTMLACEVAPNGGDQEQIWFVTTDSEDLTAYCLDTTAHATVELVGWEQDQILLNAYDHDGSVVGKLVNPKTGQSTTIDRRTGGALLHSRNGISLFRVGPRSNRLVLLIRPDGSWTPLLPTDAGSTTDMGFVLRTGVIRQPGDHNAEPTEAERDTQMKHGGEASTAGAEHSVVLVRTDHQDTRYHLLEVTHGPGKAAYRKIAHREDADLEQFVVSEDGSTVALLWNSEGYSDIEVLDITGPEPRTIAVPDLPALVATEPTLTADGRLLSVGVSGPEFPPSVMVYDVAKGNWAGEGLGLTASAVGSAVSDTPEVDVDEQPRDQRNRPVLSAWENVQIIPELLHYTARDGLALSGWLYRAVGHPEDRPAPTVVYIHGGPEGQSRPSYNNVLRKLAAYGYTVFQPNVRGSLGRGRYFSQADDRYGRFSAIDDVEDTLDFLIASGLSAEGSNILMGRSYGGYVVHASLTRHAGRWQAGIAACGMSDFLTFFRDTAPWVGAAAHPKYGHPELDRELLREASPIHTMGRVRVPVLFVHGQRDSTVPISESYQAIGVLAAHGVRTEFLTFADEGHRFEKLTNRRTISHRVLDFCAEIIGDARA